MGSARPLLLAAIVAALATPAQAMKPMSDKARLRAEAEHLCYDEVQKLCNDAILDEGRITACMKAKRAKLSPGCGKVSNRGSTDRMRNSRPTVGLALSTFGPG